MEFGFPLKAPITPKLFIPEQFLFCIGSFLHNIRTYEAMTMRF